MVEDCQGRQEDAVTTANSADGGGSPASSADKAKHKASKHVACCPEERDIGEGGKMKTRRVWEMLTWEVDTAVPLSRGIGCVCSPRRRLNWKGSAFGEVV